MFKHQDYGVKTNLLDARVRKHIVDMTHLGGSSHVGSGLSIADILSVLSGEIMMINPKNPSHKDRDRFILSKGHAGACVYATLSELGFFDKEMITWHYPHGSTLSGNFSH